MLACKPGSIRRRMGLEQDRMRFANNQLPIPSIADWDILTGACVSRSRSDMRSTIALMGYLYKRPAASGTALHRGKA